MAIRSTVPIKVSCVRQFIQPLYVSGMQRVGDPGMRFDNEGRGYGFCTVRYLEPKLTERPTTCKMERP